MRPAEILLRHERLDERARSLSGEVERLERELGSNPEAERLVLELGEHRSALRDLQLQLKGSERDVEDHRSRMKAREKELMSGRVRNPTELMQMSEEVEHMKARLRGEEEQELALMEQADREEHAVRALEAELEKVNAAAEASAPELRSTLERARAELSEVEAERERLWAEVPPAFQATARRIRVRPAAAEVAGGQCSACRVQVTSSAMQVLRRGEDPVTCENCGRVLALA